MTIWDFASAHWFVALLMLLVVTAPIRLAVHYHFNSKRSDGQ